MRASVELTDDAGQVVGVVRFGATYRTLADDSRVAGMFKDDNIRVHEEHTSRTIDVDGVTPDVDGIVVTELDCAGSEHLVDGPDACKAFRVGGPTHGGFDRAVVTPYVFELRAEGRDGPVGVTCDLFELEWWLHIPGSAG